MYRKIVPVVAMLIGIGCSHASPKPKTAQAALASPPSAPPPAPRQEVSEAAPSPEPREDLVGNEVFFDFDSALLGAEARSTLQQIGKKLVHSGRSVRIEGNCDERGTTEYNLVLGEGRARAARSYLQHLGVPGRRISVVSYGSERPRNPGHHETAWAQNRRDDFVIR
jgi:peptidoglycan-associated lipoprotein